MKGVDVSVHNKPSGRVLEKVTPQLVQGAVPAAGHWKPPSGLTGLHMSVVLWEFIMSSHSSSPVANGVLDILVHLGIGLIKAFRLEDGVPSAGGRRGRPEPEDQPRRQVASAITGGPSHRRPIQQATLEQWPTRSHSPGTINLCHLPLPWRTASCSHAHTPSPPPQPPGHHSHVRHPLANHQPHAWAPGLPTQTLAAPVAAQSCRSSCPQTLWVRGLGWVCRQRCLQNCMLMIIPIN